MAQRFSEKKFPKRPFREGGKRKPSRFRPKKKPLTIQKILEWADAHKERTGVYPTEKSGEVFDVPQENWNAIAVALRSGHRGLDGGSSLALILETYRGRVHRNHRPDFFVEQILV